MNNTESVINFMYFGTNHPYNFIEKVWADDLHLAKHFQDKFNGSKGFFDFFFELSLGNKRKLIEWANENYQCGMY